MGRWTDGGVFCSPDCGVREVRSHYGVHRGLCEKEKVQVVLVQHRDDVDQGGDVGSCLLSVDGEESPTAVDKGSGESPGDTSGSARIEVGRSERSEGEGFPSRRSLGEEGRWLPGSGGRGPGRKWGGDPEGECGKGKETLVEGLWRIRYDGSLFQSRLGRLLGRGSGGAGLR